MSGVGGVVKQRMSELGGARGASEDWCEWLGQAGTRQDRHECGHGGTHRPLIPPFDPEETYERLEADKKKQVHKKRKCPGPIITYHSVTVPLVGEPGPKEENVDVEG